MSPTTTDLAAFVHDSSAQRVVFAPGAAKEAAIREAGLSDDRILVIGRGSAAAFCEELADSLGPRAVRLREVAVHVPADLAERARAYARAEGVTALIAVGGGSAIGLAKAIAIEQGQPIAAVPTTFSGSEATAVWGITTDGVKTTGVDERALARVIVYDSSLTATMPTALAVESGLNALAHSIDALWAPRRDPINSALAAASIPILRRALLSIAADSGDLSARGECFLGGYLAAVSFSSAGSGLHHKICHVLGGAYGLPHAATHVRVLPHAVAFNAPAAPEAAEAIARGLDAPSAQEGLAGLYDALGAHTRLRDLGVDLDILLGSSAAIAAAVPPSNPRPVDERAIAELLRSAW